MIHDTTLTKRRGFLGATAGLLGLGSVGIAAGEGHSEINAEIYQVFGEQIIHGPEVLPGELFDVESAKVTGNGRVLHHELPIGDGKPYILIHEGEGRYTPRGATVNFRGPDGLWPQEGRWRAIVREDVQATATGDFGWSVTRVDIFSRPRMTYSGSMIIAVWDTGFATEGVPDDLVGGYVAKGPANPGGQSRGRPR